MDECVIDEADIGSVMEPLAAGEFAEVDVEDV